MILSALQLKTGSQREPTRLLVCIDGTAYTLEWMRGEKDARVLQEASASTVLSAFPFPASTAASALYARYPALRAFLTERLPEEALWKTVRADHVLALVERSSFWWGGNGLVDRTAHVQVHTGWNPYVAGTRLPRHLFEEGRLLIPGDHLPLCWDETSVTVHGPQTLRCRAWLVNEGGQARITPAKRTKRR